MEKYDKCTATEFKTDKDQLCENCPLPERFKYVIENQIIFFATEQREVLTEQNFKKWLNAEIEGATKAMQKAYLLELQNKDCLEDPNRPKRVEHYIFNKERLKALKNFSDSKPEKPLQKITTHNRNANIFSNNLQLEINTLFSSIIHDLGGIKVVAGDNEEYRLNWDNVSDKRKINHYLTVYQKGAQDAKAANTITECITILKRTAFYFEEIITAPRVEDYSYTDKEGIFHLVNIGRSPFMDKWLQDKILEPVQLKIEKLQKLKELFPDDTLTTHPAKADTPDARPAAPLPDGHQYPATAEQTKAEKLNAKIKEYGFFELPKVKSLSIDNQNKLIVIISQKKVPYQIAMFSFLGFIEHLEKLYFPTKEKLNKAVSNWIGSDSTGRAVKGNISVLEDVSKEKKDRYTAHLHKETVIQEYQNLK